MLIYYWHYPCYKPHPQVTWGANLEAWQSLGLRGWVGSNLLTFFLYSIRPPSLRPLCLELSFPSLLSPDSHCPSCLPPPPDVISAPILQSQHHAAVLQGSYLSLRSCLYGSDRDACPQQTGRSRRVRGRSDVLTSVFRETASNIYGCC